MKYKISDKIKIKTWDAMAEEYGLGGLDKRSIPCRCSFNLSMETGLQQLDCNRILTIKTITNNKSYRVVEMSWEFSDDMIEGLATMKKQIDNEQKTFRDLLGRDIKVGDNVIHLWTKLDARGYPKGGEGAINKKLATVIKHAKNGIGIEWRDSHDKRKIKRSTIFNTRNRLIILDGKKLNLHLDDIVKDVEEANNKERKYKNTRIKNLKSEIKLIEDNRDEIFKENEELKEAIEMLAKGSERFSMLDL